MLSAMGSRLNSKMYPEFCHLCGAVASIVPCGFRQVYPQKRCPPISVDWWECERCRGWFADPIPTSQEIERYWQTVPWNDPKYADEIAQGKDFLYSRLLEKMSCLTPTGSVLDLGCNFGHFLRRAAHAGWTPSGFEPNIVAAETARTSGFDVRSGWLLRDVDFAESYFAAVTVIDVLAFVWNPLETLQTTYRLLRPGGVIAMRISNKRLVLGLARALTAAGAARDARISTLLQGQFHSMGLNSLSRIMREIGFRAVRIQPNATVAPWRATTWRTRIAYLGANILYCSSRGTFNLSPGCLLFANKEQQTNSLEANRF